MGNINRPGIARSSSGGLIQSSDKFTGGWYKAEIRPRVVLEQNMVTKDIAETNGG